MIVVSFDQEMTDKQKLERARKIVARHFPDKEGIAAGLWDSHGVMKAVLEALEQSDAAQEEAMLREPMKNLVEDCDELGKWMSAALDDPKVCVAMKTDISVWFSALDEAREALSPHTSPVQDE